MSDPTPQQIAAHARRYGVESAAQKFGITTREVRQALERAANVLTRQQMMRRVRPR